MAELEQEVRRGHLEWVLLYSMAAGPLAWGFDLGFSYALAQHACSTGHSYVLHLITAVCFAVAVSGLVTAVGVYRKVPEDAHKKGLRIRDRVDFQAVLGIAFSVAFAVIIIAGAVPRWVLDPCQ